MKLRNNIRNAIIRMTDRMSNYKSTSSYIDSEFKFKGVSWNITSPIIKLYMHQRILLDAMDTHSYVAYDAPRQHGKTMLLVIKAIVEVCSKTNKTIQIASPNIKMNDMIRERIISGLDGIPWYSRPLLVSMSKVELVFSNGMRIIFHNRYTEGVDILYIDEFDCMRPESLDTFGLTDQYIVYDNVFIVSTKSTDKIPSTFAKIASNTQWDAHSGYWYEVPDRDDNWREDMIDALGSEKLFDQVFYSVKG